jgi:glycine hydroxymethyltransferase
LIFWRLAFINKVYNGYRSNAPQRSNTFIGNVEVIGMTSVTENKTDIYSAVEQTDPEAYEILMAEGQRQANCLELIASENHVSQSVLQTVGSVLTNKYAEGYPGRRYYGGCQHCDQAEDLARERAKKLFNCDHVNVQPHSGSQANIAVYMAVLMPGDTILSLDLAHGGHLSHGLKVNFSGRMYNIVSYGVNRETETFDMAEVRRLAKECKPKLIITGASAYPRTIDFAAFQEIADEVGAQHMADIAHIAGMVAVGLHPSPIPYAGFVTTTTHKTLRGPRGGMIMCKTEHAKVIDSRIFPGTQGGPLMHVIAGKAVAFGEALKPGFKDYQQKILENAQSLAEALAGFGYRLVSGGTDNHLMLVDLCAVHKDITGKQAETWLENAGLIVNKNMIPFDQRKPTETSGLRIGTPAVTTRGLAIVEMAIVAELIHETISARGSEDVTSKVRGRVLELCEQFPLAH